MKEDTLEHQLEHCGGKDCTCAAWGECECSCGVDWTPAEVYLLRDQVDALRKDAERYRWLRKHYGSVNFEPGDHDGMDLIFCVPQGEVSANCDKTVDALMQGANT